MSEPVTLNFVSNDVLGGEWLQWADGFSSLSDLVDQSLEQAGGQPIERLIIAAHGAEKTKGFVVFDVDLSGNELIVGATVGKTHVSEVVGEQFGRLEGHWADEAIIEMRVCEFGTEMNGTNAMQALADAAGVPVTAPMDTISSLGLVGGVSTNWKTVYPTSWDRPVEVGFWRGEPTGAPPVPFPPPAAPLVTPPQTAVAAEPTDPPPSDSGSGKPMPVKKIAIGAGATAIAILALMGLFATGGDDEAQPSDPVVAGPTSETATEPEEPVDEPVEEVADEPAAMDVCSESALGCQDMGVLLDPQMVTVVWTDTGCDVTPENTTGEMVFRASTGGTGAVMPGDVPGHIFHFGSDMVDGRGLGGGTSSSDGVTTGERTYYDPLGVTPDGFFGNLETWEGPANSETGEIDRTQGDCTFGGDFELQMDPASWETLMAGPMLESTPFETTGFSCITSWVDGGPIVYWSVGVDSPYPEPFSPFSTVASLRLGSWVVLDALADETSMFPDFPSSGPPAWDLDPAYDGMQMPGSIAEPYDSGGGWGQINVQQHGDAAALAGGEEADAWSRAMSGFEEGEFVDLQLKVVNGVLAAFTTSIECIWE